MPSVASVRVEGSRCALRAPPRSTIRATRTLRITHADGLDRAFSKRAKESQSHLCWTMCKTLAAVQHKTMPAGNG